MVKKKLARQTVWIAFAIVLVDMLGVGILIPVIPLLFTDPSYPYHLALSAHNGYLLLGVLTALYPGTMFFATPILGQLSDTFGRKPLLVISLLGTTLSYVLFGLGVVFQYIPLLFFARALDGITGANVSVAQAALADTSSEKDRASKFGIISIANGIGFILGPLVGAFLSEGHLFSWITLTAATPFWFAAILSLLNMAAVIFFFPETLAQKKKTSINFMRAFENIKEAAVGGGRRSLYITTFLFQSGFAFIITFFGLFLVSRFDFGQREIGYLFAFVGLMLALTQVLFTRPLANRIAPEITLTISFLAMSLALVGVYVSRTPFMLYLYTIPAAIGTSFILTNLTALISTSSKDHEQGSVLGINSSVQALAQTIPPLFAGLIAAIFAPTTPVLFAAFTVAAGGIFFSIKRNVAKKIKTAL